MFLNGTQMDLVKTCSEISHSQGVSSWSEVTIPVMASDGTLRLKLDNSGGSSAGVTYVANVWYKVDVTLSKSVKLIFLTKFKTGRRNESIFM